MKPTEIKIPKGCKATMRQDGDMIVIEYEEQRKFKKGDFVHHECGNYAIFKEVGNLEKCVVYATIVFGKLQISENNIPHCGYMDGIDRYASEEEKKTLIEELNKVGKDWDAEKMEVVDYVWRPKCGEMYYYPSVGLASNCYIPSNSADKYRVERGLVFKTKEEAISCAEKMLNSIK